MKLLKLFYLLTVLTIVLTSCGKEGKLLRAEEYGADWPLKAAECYVRCEGNFAVVINVEGEDYAVNDAAKKLEKYKKVKAITKDNPNYPGEAEKMSLADIEFEGLKLCE